MIKGLARTTTARAPPSAQQIPGPGPTRVLDKIVNYEEKFYVTAITAGLSVERDIGVAASSPPQRPIGTGYLPLSEREVVPDFITHLTKTLCDESQSVPGCWQPYSGRCLTYTPPKGLDPIDNRSPLSIRELAHYDQPHIDENPYTHTAEGEQHQDARKISSRVKPMHAEPAEEMTK